MSARSARVEPTEECARLLDARDALTPYADRFYKLPGRVYMNGNSLGLLCRESEEALTAALHAWKRLAVDGWTDASSQWFTLAESLGARIASLIGADADEVVVTNSTTVNLHQLLSTLWETRSPRTVILTDDLSFPSDSYAVQSHVRGRGLDPATALVRVTSADGLTLDEDDIIAAMSDRVAVAVLPSVIYTSGQLLDMPRLTSAAHARGVKIGFDCSHSVGVMPHRLTEWGADFAFWCSYKYLNGGPGAAGGLYLNHRHFRRPPGIAGWFSSRKETQFMMASALDPAPNAASLQIGTPNILSMAPLDGALRVVESAGVAAIRAKSVALTDYLIALADRHLVPLGFTLVTPREPCRRGAHIALAHPDARSICAAMHLAGVIPDYRPPNVVRLGPAPLYTTFHDCYRTVATMCTVMQSGAYRAVDLPGALVI